MEKGKGETLKGMDIKRARFSPSSHNSTRTRDQKRDLNIGKPEGKRGGGKAVLLEEKLLSENRGTGDRG